MSSVNPQSSTSAATPEVADGNSLPLRLAALMALCVETLRRDFGAAHQRPPILRRSPEAWFDLLGSFPEEASAKAAIAEATAVALPWQPAGEVARYVILQSILVAAPRVIALPVDPVVKHLFYTRFAQFSRPQPQWRSHFDIHGWRYPEMAQMATLRRFPGGQHDWETSGLPRSWLIKTHPLALPSLLHTLGRMGGFAPLAKLHLDYWRSNPLMVLKGEAERSLHRLARSMALQPAIRGLMASSWFYSPAVGQITPHLAWLHDFFGEHGAYIGEMEPAPPDTGYLTGSAKRQRSFKDGQFQPRMTLVLWRRQDILAWAASRPELAEPTGSPTGRL